MMVSYPFSAVVGQQPLKLALILAAINPLIGGVLISGPRGSAKSTLARGVAQLLPEANELVTLPLGATEEMVVGTLDLQRVLDDQQVAFNPGLLARADGGVLYVDEVNLLNDALVDVLLDVAASGVNHVERDGISHTHAASFVLVGTMNPDEGELRPQLQDRFGLAVALNNEYSIAERVAIVERREAFDRQTTEFLAQYQAQQQSLLDHVATARDRLPQIDIASDQRVSIAERCQQAGVDGMRADIVWSRAACAHAAWCERSSVTEQDIDAVAELVLLHRKNASSNPPAQPPAFQRPPPPSSDATNQGGSDPTNGSGEWGSLLPESQMTATRSVSESLIKPSHSASNQWFAKSQLLPGRHKGRSANGWHRAAMDSTRPNWFSTLIANVGVWPPKALRMKPRHEGAARLHFILLDTSASTLYGRQSAQAKAIALAISQQAYLAREQLSIWGFGNDRVDRLLPKVRAPKQLRSFLDQIQAGGGTPLREGVMAASRYLQRLNKQHPDLQIRTYLITDGRSSQQVADVILPGTGVLIDVESARVKRGRGITLSQQLKLRYLPLGNEVMV